jgi:hypothetical protein
MLDHQCVVNVPMYDCLKFCEKTSKCAGTEWNQLLIRSEPDGYLMYENVCCPESIIRRTIPRRDQFNRGKFYVKKKLQDIIARDRIILTKANFNKTTQSNNQFELQINDPGFLDPGSLDPGSLDPLTRRVVDKI